MVKLRCAYSLLLLLLSVVTHAQVYYCVNEKGEKYFSDRGCPVSDLKESKHLIIKESSKGFEGLDTTESLTPSQSGYSTTLNKSDRGRARQENSSRTDGTPHSRTSSDDFFDRADRHREEILEGSDIFERADKRRRRMFGDPEPIVQGERDRPLHKDSYQNTYEAPVSNTPSQDLQPKEDFPPGLLHTREGFLVPINKGLYKNPRTGERYREMGSGLKNTKTGEYLPANLDQE